MERKEDCSAIARLDSAAVADDLVSKAAATQHMHVAGTDDVPIVML